MPKRSKAYQSPHRRKTLDKRLMTIRVVEKHMAPPEKGWIHAIRNVLGMTTQQLAQRLGVSQPRVVSIEKDEVRQKLTMETLQKVAEAMGCRLVYAFIPDSSLEETVQHQAEKRANAKVRQLKRQKIEEEQEILTEEEERMAYDVFVEEFLHLTPSDLWQDSLGTQ